jgi:putative redox protein
MADSARTPIVITSEGGLKFAAQVRSHRLLLDQPEKAGGEDHGPMPIEMLGVSLGSCVALYVRQFLASRELSYEGLRVEVEQQGASNPGRIGRFTVRVFVPTEVPPQYAELLDRVSRSCPAHNTLHEGAEVELTITTPAAISTATA